MTRWWRWGARSNEQAVTNAREASTRLSRRRVEREEIARFCRQRYDRGRPAGRPPVDVKVAEASR